MSNKINVKFKMKDIKFQQQYLFDTNKLEEIEDGIYLYQDNANDFMHSSGTIFAAATTCNKPIWIQHI